MNDIKLELANNFSQQELKAMLENHFDWSEDGETVYTMKYFIKESTQSKLRQLKDYHRFNFSAKYVVILNRSIKALDDLTQALSSEEWFDVIWDNLPLGNGDSNSKLCQKVEKFLA